MGSDVGEFGASVFIAVLVVVVVVSVHSTVQFCIAALQVCLDVRVWNPHQITEVVIEISAMIEMTTGRL